MWLRTFHSSIKKKQKQRHPHKFAAKYPLLKPISAAHTHAYENDKIFKYLAYYKFGNVCFLAGRNDKCRALYQAYINIWTFSVLFISFFGLNLSPFSSIPLIRWLVGSLTPPFSPRTLSSLVGSLFLLPVFFHSLSHAPRHQKCHSAKLFLYTL